MGIRGKLLYSTGTLAFGYILFFALMVWTTTTTQRHLRIASNALFPAASSLQAAEASFQKLTKSYKDAVMLQDASAIHAGDREAQAGAAALEVARAKLAFNPDFEQRAGRLLRHFTELRERSERTYEKLSATSTMSAEMQVSLAQIEQETAQLEREMVEFRELIGTQSYQAELEAVTASNDRQGVLGFVLFAIAVVISVAADSISRTVLGETSFSALRNSMPIICGMCWSEMTRSKSLVQQCCSALKASVNVSICSALGLPGSGRPGWRSARLRALSTLTSSSTSRMRRIIPPSEWRARWRRGAPAG